MRDVKLTAAVERMRDLASYGELGIGAGTTFYNDMQLLSQAYLAEHPADNDDPVTEQWLRSVGFVDQPKSRLALKIEIPSIVGGNELRIGDYMNPETSPWEVWNESEGNFSGCAMIVDELPTRGHVRRLCAALGIELKEPTT